MLLAKVMMFNHAFIIIISVFKFHYFGRPYLVQVTLLSTTEKTFSFFLPLGLKTDHIGTTLIQGSIWHKSEEWSPVAATIAYLPQSHPSWLFYLPT